MSIFSSNRSIENYDAIFGKPPICDHTGACESKRRNYSRDAQECVKTGPCEFKNTEEK